MPGHPSLASTVTLPAAVKTGHAFLKLLIIAGTALLVLVLVLVLVLDFIEFSRTRTILCGTW
jgi:hypothetical protein